MKNYKERLRELREDRDLSQREIAELLNCTQTAYGKWENGKRDIKIDDLIKLAKFYNVSLDYLAGITDIPKTLDGSPYTTKSYSINQKGNITNNFN